MRVYIDESGCMGLENKPGSTKFFGVVAVFFKDDDESSRCYNAVDALRKELRVTKEFKFNKCSDTIKDRFFEFILNFDFSYSGVVIIKDKLLVKKKELIKPFIYYPVVSVFGYLAMEMERASVIMDKTGSSELRKEIERSVKNEINTRFGKEVIRKVKAEESHRNSLLQVADMICGAVTRSYSQERKNPSRYRDMIKSKEATIIEWP